MGRDSIGGGSCWIEGCAIDQPVSLAGENVVIGVDVDQPLELPAAGLPRFAARPGSQRGKP